MFTNLFCQPYINALQKAQLNGQQIHDQLQTAAQDLKFAGLLVVIGGIALAASLYTLGYRRGARHAKEGTLNIEPMPR
jgi:hypothetical protein